MKAKKPLLVAFAAVPTVTALPPTRGHTTGGNGVVITVSGASVTINFSRASLDVIATRGPVYGTTEYERRPFFGAARNNEVRAGGLRGLGVRYV